MGVIMPNSQSRRTGLLLMLLPVLLLFPALASATAYELSHLASQLNFASTRLAHDLRGNHGYSRVRFSAERLGREAEQLVESISRDRSRSHIRSQLDDVRRRYEDLEKAVLRIDGGRHREFVFEQMDQISSLYGSLNAEFYYDPRTRRPVPRYYDYFPRPGLIVPRSYQYRQYNGQHQQSRQEQRRGTGRYTARRPMQFDHRSSVLERQQRQERQRRSWRRLDSHARGRTETRRRNHYE